MENSKINWTDHTWNPWIGCRHVSAECDHCYADALVTNRMGRDFSSITRTKTWKEPPKWNRRAPELATTLGRHVRVFCASLTDFFIQDADQWRDEAWDVIRQCSDMDWLILTKRPALIEKRLPADWGSGWPHVWLGTTCGARSSYPRLDALREIPATVRFISAEPLLESMADINLTGFHWLIAGGESGSGFRPMEDSWAIELRDSCVSQNVGFHFKQHSAFRSGQGAELDGKRYHEPPLIQIDMSTAIQTPKQLDGEETNVTVTHEANVTVTKSTTSEEEMRMTSGEFDQWVAEKRQRPIGICNECGGEKELRQRSPEPLCGACYMKIDRQEKKGSVQEFVRLQPFVGFLSMSRCMPSS